MEINKTLTKVETAFNVAGSVPLLGMLSGPARVAASKVQFIAGAFIAMVSVLAQLVNEDAKWERYASQGLDHVIHGMLNMVRGVAETITAATVILSIPMFASQYFSNNKFSPVVKYDEPIKLPNVIERAIEQRFGKAPEETPEGTPQ